MGRNGDDMGMIWELYGHDMENGKTVAKTREKQTRDK